MVECMSCDAQGKVRLWTVTGYERCAARPEAKGAHSYELYEPLRRVGRSTALPVRQLLVCPAEAMGRTVKINS